MIERIIVFLVLGFFVFTPDINALIAGMPALYDIYILWLLLIVAAMIDHFDQPGSRG